MTNQKMLEHIGELEDEIQMLKLASISSTKTISSSVKKGIVKTTAGLLGKNFPSGIVYERKIRKDWDKRFKKLGL